MESEQNNIYEQEKNVLKEKNKPIAVHKQFLDDSETYEHSSKYKNDYSEKNNSSIEELNKGLKKSIGFFKKKIYIEKPEEDEKNINKRTYSMEEHLIIKDFVPQLKPIEIHLVPSKLRLNQKGFRDLKNNKNNNYFISCPNSEEEEESDICLSPQKTSPIDKNANIKKTRKIFQKMKRGSMPKVFSRNLIESNCKLYKDDLKIEFDSEKDSLDLGDENLLLYDDNDFLFSNNNHFDGENKKENEEDQKENEEHGVRNNRINSCSILDVLKNRFSIDDTY